MVLDPVLLDEDVRSSDPARVVLDKPAKAEAEPVTSVSNSVKALSDCVSESPLDAVIKASKAEASDLNTDRRVFRLVPYSLVTSSKEDAKLERTRASTSMLWSLAYAEYSETAFET